MRRWVAIVCAGMLLAGCGGGGGANPVPKAPAAPSSKTRVSVSITLHVPGASTAKTAALKRIYTIAQNTAGVQIDAFPAGSDTGTPLAASVANITASGTGTTCGASDAYGNRTCTFSISAPLGTEDFVITTWDQAPATGATTIPAGANELGIGTDAGVVIAAGGTYTIAATLSSVLASVTLTATPSAFHQMQPSTGTIGVIALDADSDVIVSNGFVDVNGNPVSIALGLDNSLNGTLNLATSSIGAPALNGVQYQYTPSTGFLPNTSSVTATITATPSNTNVSSSTNVNAVYPAFTNIPDNDLGTYNVYHGGMAFDPAGGVYFSTENGAYGTVDYYSGSGNSTSTQYTGSAITPIHGGVTGYAGQLYVVSGALILGGNMNDGVSLGSFGSVPVSNGSALAVSSSGTFAYASSATIQTVTCSVGCSPNSSYTTNVIPAAGVTYDSSGNIWMVDNVDNNNAIYEVTGGSVNGPIYLGTPGNAFDILANSNGLFLTSPTGNAIVQTNASGTNATAFTLPNQISPWYLMPDTDPNNGVLWFSYNTTSGQIGIGRFDTNKGLITLATDPNPTSPLVYSAGAIGAAINGMVYIVADGGNALVQVSR